MNWGLEWETPSLNQIFELVDNCTTEWATVNGTGGYIFKSNSNDNAIFFPLPGWNPRGTGLDAVGNYWSRGYRYDIWPNLAYVLCVSSMVILVPMWPIYLDIMEQTFVLYILHKSRGT